MFLKIRIKNLYSRISRCVQINSRINQICADHIFRRTKLRMSEKPINARMLL